MSYAYWTYGSSNQCFIDPSVLYGLWGQYQTGCLHFLWASSLVPIFMVDQSGIRGQLYFFFYNFILLRSQTHDHGHLDDS